MTMDKAWIQLECPSCQEVWEGALDSLPELGTEFECPYCGARSSVAVFVKTQEGLKILEEFQG
jgi:predicted RNA-binding Zn-ribbon protein involved in translation (DUF1610 family)